MYMKIKAYRNCDGSLPKRNMISMEHYTIVAFIRGENLLTVDNLMLTSYEGNNCFIILKLLLKMFIA